VSAGSPIFLIQRGAQFGPPGFETDLLYLACLAAIVLGHASGDWGEVNAVDRAANDYAVPWQNDCIYDSIVKIDEILAALKAKADARPQSPPVKHA